MIKNLVEKFPVTVAVKNGKNIATHPCFSDEIETAYNPRDYYPHDVDVFCNRIRLTSGMGEQFMFEKFAEEDMHQKHIQSGFYIIENTPGLKELLSSNFGGSMLIWDEGNFEEGIASHEFYNESNDFAEIYEDAYKLIRVQIKADNSFLQNLEDRDLYNILDEDIEYLKEIFQYWIFSKINEYLENNPEEKKKYPFEVGPMYIKFSDLEKYKEFGGNTECQSCNEEEVCECKVDYCGLGMKEELNVLLVGLINSAVGFELVNHIYCES